MKTASKLKHVYIACAALFVLTASNISAKTIQIQTWIDEFKNFRFDFSHDPTCRYTMEISSDLTTWEEHWVSPVEIADNEGDGYSSGGIGNRTREFMRLRSIPWKFEPVISSTDWLGDFRTAFTGEGSQMVLFQNRVENTLFLTKYDDIDGWSEPEPVVSTGVPDEPSHWDNNGYHGVEFHVLSDNSELITCVDQYNGEVICLSRSSSESEWTRHTIASGFSVAAWVSVGSAVSNGGTIAITYGDAAGCYLYTAPVGNIGSGDNLLIASSDPSKMAITFAGTEDTLIAQIGDEMSIDLNAGTIRNLKIPGNLASTVASDGRIFSTTVRDEGVTVYSSDDKGESWDSNYIDLGEIDGATICFSGNGDMFALASWYSRLIAYHSTDSSELQSIRIANGGEVVGDFYLRPDGKLGVILVTNWGDSTVTLAHQE